MADAIYTDTLGHAGIVSTTLKLISSYFVREFGPPNPTAAEMVEYLLSWKYYNNISATRAVPTNVTDVEKDILREIILNGYFRLSENKLTTASELLKSGNYQ